MTSDADRELIERFRGGDRRAFDGLVSRYQDPLRKLVRRYVKTDEDARDVVQKAFARAFEKLATYRGDASFKAWLYRLAINVAIRHGRGAAHEDIVPLEDVPAFTNALETAKLVAAEVWRNVAACLDELPPKQRLVLELRLFHELEFDEVAVIADCSVESARVNFHHAVQRVRKIIPTAG